MKILNRNILLMVLAFLSNSIIGNCNEVNDIDKTLINETAKFVKNRELLAKSIIELMGDERLPSDRVCDLIEAGATAKVFGEGDIKFLIDHIEYPANLPPGRRKMRDIDGRTISRLYPVVLALSQLGIPAANGCFEILQKNNVDKKKRDLLCFVIMNVYGFDEAKREIVRRLGENHPGSLFFATGQ